MAQHAFVAMPFGTKQNINFNRIYSDYIKPALESAGFEVFRADEEERAGNIRTDMFQELLLADLVVADLSIDNPNVWYELGVRHALRPRGVIQIQCGREYMPFDVYVDRTLQYHIKDGVPDKEFLEADKLALAKYATETMNAWYGRKVSPVYSLLPYLDQPDWKSLRVGGVEEFWEAHENWESLIEIALRDGRPGDVMVLAQEAPTRMLQLEAHRIAGKALLKLGQYEYALDQYERALAINPKDLESRRQKGLLLGRLKKYSMAKVWLTNTLKANPGDSETWGLLGRIEKDVWVKAWRIKGRTAEQMRNDAVAEIATLREAINAYQTGFRNDPDNYYPGINALTLWHLLDHLSGHCDRPQERRALAGGVRWAAQSQLNKTPTDYWTRATLADLELLTGNVKRLTDAYKSAVAVAENDKFALDSSRQQLKMLQDLGYEPAKVNAALSVFDRALSRKETSENRPENASPSQDPPKPQVFLFSGHMIDRKGRPEPRFPPEMIPIAAAEIEKTLAKLGAGENDLAICGGACGGDLLFAEACLKRGLRLTLHLPLAEPAFLAESVCFAGDEWRDRYYAARKHPNTRILVCPEELGPTPKNRTPFVRNNLWMLYTALSMGPDLVRFICLWNGKEGDGPGGAKHMHDTVQKYSAQVYVLNTTKLW